MFLTGHRVALECMLYDIIDTDFVIKFCIRIVFFVTFREFLLWILLKNPWFSCLKIGDAVVLREV